MRPLWNIPRGREQVASGASHSSKMLRIRRMSGEVLTVNVEEELSYATGEELSDVTALKRYLALQSLTTRFRSTVLTLLC